MKDGFVVPPDHVNFQAKRLFGSMGRIIDGSIAYITLKGGGPLEQHTHEHDHLFIVVKGEAVVFAENRKVVIHENESYLVKGNIPHSVWSNLDGETVMVGISVQ